MFTLFYLPTAILLFFIMSMVNGIVDTFKEYYRFFAGMLLWCVAVDYIAIYILGVKC